MRAVHLQEGAAAYIKNEALASDACLTVIIQAAYGKCVLRVKCTVAHPGELLGQNVCEHKNYFSVMTSVENPFSYTKNFRLMFQPEAM